MSLTFASGDGPPGPPVPPGPPFYQGTQGAPVPPNPAFDIPPLRLPGQTPPAAPPAPMGGGQPHPDPLGDPSGQLEPQIRSVRDVPGSKWEVYAIHGLNSSVATWRSNINGFNWLTELSNYLTGHGGEAVSTYMVGWSTRAFQASNTTDSILASARPLANKIVGLRGESRSVAYKNAGKEPKKVIIIGHSMGGILARGLLGFMHENRQAENYGPFLNSVRGVILLASPSLGSTIAGWADSIIRGLGTITPGLNILVNPAHMLALRPNSPELAQITASFDKYCQWCESTLRVKLIVNALRETAKMKIGNFGVTVVNELVVSLESASVPKSTQPHVHWRVQNLNDLNHTQVTSYTSMEDPNLKVILASFWEMQSPPPRPVIPAPAPAQQSQRLKGTALQRGPSPRGPGGAPSYPAPAQVRQQVGMLQRGRQPGQPGQPAAQGRLFEDYSQLQYPGQ